MNNTECADQARQYMPGGVNSPVRSFHAAGLPPLFVKKAKGKTVTAEDGREYTDHCLSWGVMILGHDHGVIRQAILEGLDLGTSFGLNHVHETKLARLVCELMPSIEKVRFVNSGTEAVMSAIRLARGFTGRRKIVKFDGCYHGHSDPLLVNAGSGVGELISASSSGIPVTTASDSLSIPFNDKIILEKILKENDHDIACVIIEPIPGNMGLVLPEEGYLDFVRKVTEQHGVLLIFDEVISGFRAGISGAQGYYGIKPDLTTLGKIIGGGLPVGAFGGRAEIMDLLAPDGNVYQAGTLSGNPLAMRAGYACLNYLKNNPDIYSGMDRLIKDFKTEFSKVSKWTINHIASMFTIFFTEGPVRNFQDALKQDMRAFRKTYQTLFFNGILLPPSPHETSFVSAEHNMEDCLGIVKMIKDLSV